MHGMSTPPPPFWLKNAEVYPRLTFTSFELVFQGVYLLDDDGVDEWYGSPYPLRNKRYSYIPANYQQHIIFHWTYT